MKRVRNGGQRGATLQPLTAREELRAVSMSREGMSHVAIAGVLRSSAAKVREVLHKHRHDPVVTIADMNNQPQIRALANSVRSGALSKMSAVALVKRIFDPDISA